MSSGSVGFNKSLNGNNIGEFDSIDLTQWTGALTIEGSSGTAGQVLKKNATTNKIEWGVDTPGSLSATSPIVLTGTNLALGTNFGGQGITTTGTITAGTIASTGNVTAGGVIVCKSANLPLVFANGEMNLNINTNDFQLDGSNNLELKESFVKTASNPLSISTQNISLNFNTNDFQLDGSNNLELKNDPVITASDPLSISTGNISLTLDSSKLEVSSGELTLKEDYVKTASNPLTVSGGNVSLNFDSSDFQINAQNELEFRYNNVAITASMPIVLSSGNISLSFNTNDFQLDASNQLELKDDFVKTATNPLSISTGNITLGFDTETLTNTGSALALNPTLRGKTLYYSDSEDKYYLLLRPTDFMNDNDSSGYNRTVIADTGMGGGLQCFAGTQYYCQFDIPHGFDFTGFRVNLTNSVGTEQGSTATSTFYSAFAHKTISSNLVFPNRSGASNIFAAYNTHNAYAAVGSGYDADTLTKSNFGNIKFGCIMCYRLSWTSAFYNLGGYVEFTKTPAP